MLHGAKDNEGDAIRRGEVEKGALSRGIISRAALFNSPGVSAITPANASVFARYFSFLQDLFDTRVGAGYPHLPYSKIATYFMMHSFFSFPAAGHPLRLYSYTFVYLRIAPPT